MESKTRSIHKAFVNGSHQQTLITGTKNSSPSSVIVLPCLKYVDYTTLFLARSAFPCCLLTELLTSAMLMSIGFQIWPFLRSHVPLFQAESFKITSMVTRPHRTNLWTLFCFFQYKALELI